MHNCKLCGSDAEEFYDDCYHCNSDLECPQYGGNYTKEQWQDLNRDDTELLSRASEVVDRLLPGYIARDLMRAGSEKIIEAEKLQVDLKLRILGEGNE